MTREGQGILFRDAALQDKVNKLYAEGKGTKAIAAKLNEEGNAISHMTVARYLSKVKDKKGEVIAADQQLAIMARAQILDTTSELQKVNKLLWGMVDEAQLSRQFKLQLLKEIMTTLKLADELMNRFKNLNIEQGSNSKVQLIQVVINQLDDMEKRGDIRILNSKLRMNQGNVVEAKFEEEDKNGKSES